MKDFQMGLSGTLSSTSPGKFIGLTEFYIMFKVGLTGGIGSGKTTVARIFEILHIPVYYADERAKAIMNSDPDLREKIIQCFGESAYNGSQLNRSFIASVVFSEKQKLLELNALVHPVTIADSEYWMKAQSSAYAIKEAALIFESKINVQLDYIIGVYTPALLRMQRVTARDPISPEEVEQRMKNQMDEDEKMGLCDFVIINDENQALIPQVLKLHEKLLTKSAERSGL